jgi:hypothetical protein
MEFWTPWKEVGNSSVPRNSVFLEKLTVAHLLMRFLCSYGAQKFNDPYQNQMNPLNILPLTSEARFQYYCAVYI